MIQKLIIGFPDTNRIELEPSRDKFWPVRLTAIEDRNLDCKVSVLLSEDDLLLLQRWCEMTLKALGGGGSNT